MVSNIIICIGGLELHNASLDFLIREDIFLFIETTILMISLVYTPYIHRCFMLFLVWGKHVTIEWHLYSIRYTITTIWWDIYIFKHVWFMFILEDCIVCLTSSWKGQWKAAWSLINTCGKLRDKQQLTIVLFHKCLELFCFWYWQSYATATLTLFCSYQPNYVSLKWAQHIYIL